MTSDGTRTFVGQSFAAEDSAMTGVTPMIEFTPEAEARLADYLRQVRAALAGAADVSPDEIESDIREHVENELRAAPRPVGRPALEAVLARLGPPAQWGAGDNPSLLGRLGHALRGAGASLGARLRAAREAVWRGPEDWRLTYLAFGVFAVGVLTVIAFPVCLPVSYLLARAGVAHAREKGVELGARKWLLYPPLVFVSTVLLVAVVALPVAVGGMTAKEVTGAENRVASFDRPNPEPTDPRDWRAMRDWQAREAVKEGAAKQVEEDRKLLAAIPVAPRWAPAAAGLFVGAGACLLWWTLLGVLGGTFPGAVRAVFFPLTARFRAGHGWWVAVPCAAALALWGVAAYEVAASAGVVR